MSPTLNSKALSGTMAAAVAAAATILTSTAAIRRGRSNSSSTKARREHGKFLNTAAPSIGRIEVWKRFYRVQAEESHVLRLRG